MKRILTILIVYFLGLFLFVFFANKEINNQFKSIFLSTSITVIDSFEREYILSKYDISDDIKYIKLSELDYNLNSNDIDLENSYVAFSKNNIIYLTIIGKGRYKDYSYINKKRPEINISSIEKNNNDINYNLNKINATKYGE